MSFAEENVETSQEEVTDLKYREQNNSDDDEEKDEDYFPTGDDDDSEDEDYEEEEFDSDDEGKELAGDDASKVLDELVEMFVSNTGRAPTEEEMQEWIEAMKTLIVSDDASPESTSSPESEEGNTDLQVASE